MVKGSGLIKQPESAVKFLPVFESARCIHVTVYLTCLDHAANSQQCSVLQSVNSVAGIYSAIPDSPVGQFITREYMWVSHVCDLSFYA